MASMIVRARLVIGGISRCRSLSSDRFPPGEEVHQQQPEEVPAFQQGGYVDPRYVQGQTDYGYTQGLPGQPVQPVQDYVAQTSYVPTYVPAQAPYPPQGSYVPGSNYGQGYGQTDYGYAQPGQNYGVPPQNTYVQGSNFTTSEFVPETQVQGLYAPTTGYQGNEYSGFSPAVQSYGPTNDYTASEFVPETQVQQVEESSHIQAHESPPQSSEETVAAKSTEILQDEVSVPQAASIEKKEDCEEPERAASFNEETEGVKDVVVEAAPVKTPETLQEKQESFLDILSKTTLNVRQSKSRPVLSSRPQKKTYARLYNLPRHILKSDIIQYFSELTLTKESISMVYDERFVPQYVQVGFESGEALRTAQKILQSKGRFGGRIVKVEPFIQFAAPGHPLVSESMKMYLGRMLVLLHVPVEAKPDDVERFFDGYGFDPSALSLLDAVALTLPKFREEGKKAAKRAIVGFFSSVEAMRALREKQGDFCLNDPVELRLVQ